MSSNFVTRLGAGACKGLDATGFVPEACDNIDGRGMVGYAVLGILVLMLIFAAGMRFLGRS